MKIPFLIIFLFTLFISTNGQSQNTTALHDIWMLEGISGEDIIPSPAGRPQLEIYVKELRFIGFGGCNNISGKIQKIEDQEIVFGPVLSTRKFCENGSDTETKFLNALATVRKWEKEGTRLRLYDENDAILLEFGKTD